MDCGNGSQKNLYRFLVERCRNLEASHAKLKEQVDVMLQEKRDAPSISSREEEVTSDSVEMKSFSGLFRLAGGFFSGSPYRNALEQMGHAVYVSRAESGEIIFWNRSAEKLYGYEECEVLGRGDIELLIDDEYHELTKKIMDWLCSGKSWSGQFPLRKKSGQAFMAMVTKCPLYEDGELFGLITVSSDAAIINSGNSENLSAYQDHDDGRPGLWRVNLKKTRREIAAVPHIASSAYNLASKVLSRKREDDTCNVCSKPVQKVETEQDSKDLTFEKPPRAPESRPNFRLSFRRRTDAESSMKDEPRFDLPQPSRIAAKVLSTLHIGGTGNLGNDMNGGIRQNSYSDASTKKEEETHFSSKRTSANTYHPRLVDQFSQSRYQLESEDALRRPSDTSQSASLEETAGSSHGSSSGKSENDINLVLNVEIRWEDINLREEIGQGSYAVVYRGIWKGSDVAVKVYTGCQYNEGTLLDYKKEIDIMRRLRHPNVLLFMGAVCTQEKLAIVTEFLPRGSLFKTLHKNNQQLDFRRRLRMALDVARGMNYLHHRNPPIVHRDLKSSNLLVDKSWTVKVGDFGLSRLKDATFLTTKSGRGTPQWMAPEVLRNEPSTEKSDIFSFGVILWELMTESIPWNNLNFVQVVGVVGFMDRRLDIPENLDPQITSLINDCWQSNPENRPSFEDIIRRMTQVILTFAGVAVKKGSELGNVTVLAV